MAATLPTAPIYQRSTTDISGVYVQHVGCEQPRQLGGDERAVACGRVTLDAQESGRSVGRQLADHGVQVGLVEDLPAVALDVRRGEHSPRALADSLPRVFGVLELPQLR